MSRHMDWRTDDVAWAWLGACVVPDGPDDTAAQAHNNYVRATWTGQPVDGKTSREWLAESNRLYADKESGK